MKSLARSEAPPAAGRKLIEPEPVRLPKAEAQTQEHITPAPPPAPLVQPREGGTTIEDKLAAAVAARAKEAKPSEAPPASSSAPANRDEKLGRLAFAQPGRSKSAGTTKIGQAECARSAPPTPQDKASSASPITDRFNAGMTVADLASYPIEKEPVRILISAPNSGQQSQLAWALQAFCSRSGIHDARLLDEGLRLGPDQSFYVARPIAEGAEPAEAFLVRGTVQQIGSLLDDLSHSARKDVRVALVSPQQLPGAPAPDAMADQQVAKAEAASPRLGLSASDHRRGVRNAPVPRAAHAGKAGPAAPAPTYARTSGTPQESPEGAAQIAARSQRPGWVEIAPRREAPSRTTARPTSAPGALGPVGPRPALKGLGYVVGTRGTATQSIRQTMEIHRPEHPTSAPGQAAMDQTRQAIGQAHRPPATSEPATASWAGLRSSLAELFSSRPGTATSASQRVAFGQETEQRVTIVVTIRAAMGAQDGPGR